MTKIAQFCIEVVVTMNKHTDHDVINMLTLVRHFLNAGFRATSKHDIVKRGRDDE